MLYPLRFKEILRTYSFGNRWIVEAYAKVGLPEGQRIAETWEVCDRPGESSLVINGHLAGQTLHELIERNSEALLGREVIARFGKRFPLLIKFLDASHPLGEQAHHSDALAARRGLSDPGKTEAWYMLKTRKGATIRCGQLGDQVDRESVWQALLAGTIREQMREYAVQPGDAFLLYAGTMHYSAGGVLFYEIMQNSDVFIGLRQPDPSLPAAEREAMAQEVLEGVHLESAFECKVVPINLYEGTNVRQLVMVCEYFALERLDLNALYFLDGQRERFYVLSQIEGGCTVHWQGGVENLVPGNSCLIPAGMGVVRIEPSPGCVVLKAYVPDLLKNIIQPLRALGVSDEQITALGGRTRLNPLLKLLGV
jgi:mannose-6-phosphate isomerase